MIKQLRRWNKWRKLKEIPSKVNRVMVQGKRGDVKVERSNGVVFVEITFQGKKYMGSGVTKEGAAIQALCQLPAA